MRKPVAGVWAVPDGGTTPALVAVSVCFFLGGLLGCVVASHVDGGGGESLAAYVQGFLSAARAGTTAAPPLLPLIWETVRWPLLAAILGFTALGLVGIPILLGVRGFLLSFAISSFVRMLGGTGVLLSLLIFGISGLVAVPVLFVLCVQAMKASRVLAGRALGEGKGRAPYGKRYFLRCGMCAAASVLCVLLEYLVVPALVTAAAGTLPI